MKIQQLNTTNFTGIKVASANVYAKKISEQYNLYKVGDSDKEFLCKLYESINLPRLYEGLSDYDYEMWDWVIHEGMFKSLGGKYSDTFLLADKNKKPCGIMKLEGFNEKNKILSYISTWPVVKNTKKLLAGKTLILSMFKKLINTEDITITLDAIKYSPFDPTQTYKKMGFNVIGGDNNVNFMKIQKRGIQKAIEEYSDKINIQELKETKEINLFKELMI